MSDWDGRLPDGTGLSSAAPIEPVPVSPVPASIPSADARIEYRFQRAPWCDERHEWIIATEDGAVSIWAEPSNSSINPSRHWYGGIEAHYASPPEYMEGQKPSFEHCQVLHGPCWTDGSSLQFSEDVAGYLPVPTGKPMVPHALDDVLPILRNRYRTWIAQAIEARRAETLGSVHESAVAEPCAPEQSA